MWRLDESNKLKAIPSIIAKICRLIAAREDDESAEWRKHASDPGAFLDHFIFDVLRDVARFRIVCNYIGDVRRIGGYLRDSEELRQRFPGFDPAAHYKDSIDDPERRERAQGRRAVHLSLPFRQQNGNTVWVEVQIITMLQEAWDKKDHPIYEKRRLGQEIPPPAQIKIRAMSDLLYIADEFFDSVWRDLTRNDEASGDDQE